MDKNDVVFHILRKKFGVIISEDTSIGFNVKVDNIETKGFWLIKYLILVKPDTPQQRLVVKLKHG